MKHLLWGALILLAGCGRPDIQIDSGKISQAEGNVPVGLLEVHRARSGNSYGLSLGESINESLFCTGTLLSDGRVLTSADCLRNASTSFDPDDMEFHLNEKGNPPTGHWHVERVETDPSRSGLAYLFLAGARPIVSSARKLTLGEGTLALSEANPDLEALTLSVAHPDDDGVAVGTLADTSVQYSSGGFEFPTTPPPEPPRSGPGTGTATGTSTSTDTRTTPARPGFPGLPANPGGIGGTLPGNSGPIVVPRTVPTIPRSTPTAPGIGTIGTATGVGTSTATSTDTLPGLPGRPGYPYRYGTGTSTSTATSTATDTDTSTTPPPRYAPIKALGLGDATVGSPVVVGDEIVGLVRRGTNNEGPPEVYWLDESKNPRSNSTAWEEDRQRSRR